ncbi:putative aspartic proteinase GIP2 [Sesamum alatum]|uniref:Aspartic proteinase GIP2 n=1 Tax=Sesamum alatum TaxID=300844 RepID=A0AAE1Z3T4_9LAMI|nr:putative aspartic proteinase GIP2 [Sesamum alatum]
MSPQSVVILTIFFFFFFRSSSGQALVAPIRKDKSTNLYTLSIYLKTPLQRSKLHLDLGSYFPWHDCAHHRYNSLSYRPIIENTTLCNEMIPQVIGYCYEPARPGCANSSCGFYPENPVTRESSLGDLIQDKFALPLPRKQGQPGPVSELVLTCVNTTIFSKLLRGLARGSVGLASLGRYNHSLPAQLSKSFSSPQVFAICLPSSSKDPGLVWFNSPGPYFLSPGVDLSKSLTYTPLITAPRGSDTEIYYYYPSPEYYIGLTSIKVNERSITLNKTLLAIDGEGLGGVKISSSKPYSELQTSIFQALTDAFVKEAGRLNLSLIQPAVKPFKVCYTVEGSGAGGPAVPTIDLVLQSEKVVWRIYGSNSMVTVKTKNKVDAWCLGFVDGGDAPRTSIIIGGRQLEDNLLQFDLERGRLGFSSSLLVRDSTTCSNFDKSTVN